MKWRKRFTSRQVDMDCRKYDISSIYPIDEKIKSDTWADIYISTLKRTRDTAEALFESRELKIPKSTPMY